MSFLQPMLLAALPLVALPIIIHLINQRRYQTVRWAAMMFLLAANRMSRGYARIRQWLIMAMRMAAIAGLIFAISRPLAGGWLGLAGGGKADTTIVLLDRSPSMQQGGASGSKLETGRRQLARTFETLGSARWALVESATNKIRELESAGDLETSASTEPVGASSDVPGMLGVAADYLKANKAGRTEVWLCSDLRENDWNSDGGRWQALRDAFLQFPQGVRFHLLAYPQSAPGNLAIRVTEVRRQKAGDGAELLVSLRLNREGAGSGRESIPVQFEVDGARSEVAVEMAGTQAELKDHKIPLGRGRERGFGRVSIPADANLADNAYYFVFDRPAERRAVVVAEDAEAAKPLQLAASIAPDPELRCSAEVLAPDAIGTVEWEKVALLLWQAPLPEGEAAKPIRAFVERGGRAIFFPPRAPGKGELFGVRWTKWEEPKAEVAVESWRSDEDILAKTQSGAALPVGKLMVKKWCGLAGDVTPLATLKGGATLLARATTERGGAYFCGTTPAGSDSSLARDGVVLYVLVQRALAAGAEVLSNTRQLVAGDPSGEDPNRWKRVAGAESALSTDFALQPGVYGSGDRLLAVNRSAEEDRAPALADDKVAELFKGLDFARVDDQAGNFASLTQEIWRPFLIAMMAALIVEAALCLPKPRPARTTAGAMS
jgi:hypothetical protein